MSIERIKLKSLKLFSKIPLIRQWAKKEAYRQARNSENDFACRIFTGQTMLLHIRDWVQYHLFLYGYYEKEESLFWLDFAKGDKKVIFDIGANVGYFTLLAAHATGNNSRVFAFEPVTRTFNRLKENLKLNEIKATVITEKLAVGKSDSTLTIHVGNQYNWGMSSVNQHEESSSEAETINCISLDSYTGKKGISRIDLIKIDVEGAEFDAISGMLNSIEKHRPILMIELLDTHLSKQGHYSGEIYEMLFRFNYEAWEILPAKCLRKIRTPKSYDGLVCFMPAEKSKEGYRLIQ